MANGHDFVNFPELTNSQMQIYYFESPHKQIMEDFTARVVKVQDGDTITLEWSQRDFNFPLRFATTNAPELNETGGEESKKWLNAKLLGKEVDIIINPRNRVGKYGRLLGTVFFGGMNVGLESIMVGHSTLLTQKAEGEVGNLSRAIPYLKL